MRERRQWVLYTADKIPHYVNGRRRAGVLGSEADLAALATFDDAIAQLSTSTRFAGIGFAFLEGDGLVGIDLDDVLDEETGEMREHFVSIIEACSSYTEWSPSGKGVHIIAAGTTESFKHDPVGVEVYCGGRYFTCTGDRWSSAPHEVMPLKPYAFAYLRELVNKSKAAARAASLAAAEPTVPADPRVHTPSTGGHPQGGDFKRVNDAAMQMFEAWVPTVFPGAVKRGDGYRVSSKSLNRKLQEDVSITRSGIVDFGVADMGDTREGRRSPIDLVMEWQPGMTRPKDALVWLAARVGVQLAKRLQVVSPPPAIDAAADGRPDPPPTPPDRDTAQRAGKGVASRRKNGNPPDDGGGGPNRLNEHFRLIYGTGSVWDGEKRIMMEVKSLRLLFGNEAVRTWLHSPDRRVIMQEDLVFEPGVDVPEHQVNLFDGLAMEPEPCEETDVSVMLELLRHLCGTSSDTAEGVDRVMDWVLKWLAFPLQNLGAKMRTALVFHGPQGTGKNLFFDCIRAMYGKYGRMVGQTELDDKFNDWLSAKLLIIGNEVVTRQELFHNKNKLKWIVTEDEIPIRGMHQTVRWESNHAQVVFLSNEHQPIALEKDDRRHVVVYTPAASNEDLYLRVADFLKAGGAAKFMYFLQRYDTEGFGEHAKPIMTEAKQSLIELSLKPAERFVNEWLSGLLPLPLSVCSAEQLYRVFRRWCDMNGERFPPPQAQFTKTCERHVLERSERDAASLGLPRLIYKVVTLKHEIGPRKSVRCWLPRGTRPLDGVSEGEWAASSVSSFETYADRYGRVRQEVDCP